MNNKLKVGIIGTGNIGTDLLLKISKSDLLEPVVFIGRRDDSPGISIAKKMGIATSTNSIQEIIDHPNMCELIFDATTAKVHIKNAEILKRLNIVAIDLTPARVGRMCVPSVNIEECIGEKNINMVTCGGQGTIPIISAIKKTGCIIDYVEIVASIASKSAGQGTRQNIDEFTQTTKEAICEICNIENSKAIITLNPAEPPKKMHNTIFMKIQNPDMNKIRESVSLMEESVQRYVSGYKVVMEPLQENGRITTMIEVTGAGDYLPKYAGNLDIISSAAVCVAESIAKVRVMR